MTLVFWTDDRITKLRDLWADGYTCSQAAAELGGTTRNAVIGKIHRLGLSGRDGSNASMRKFEPREVKDRAPRRRAPVPHTILPPEEIALRVAAVIPLHVTLMDLEPDQCRYPLGNQDYTFCGHQKLEGSSYCSAHFHLCAGRGTASERAAARIPLLTDAVLV